MSITIYLLDEWLRFIIGKRAAGWKWTSSSANPNECGPNPNSSKSDRSFASVYGLVVIRARAERNSEQPKEWQWAREWVANNNSKKSLTTVMVTGASPYNDATENTHPLFSVAVFRSLPNGSCRLFSSFLPIRRVSICVLAFFLCFLVCLRHLSSFLMFDKYVPCSHLRMCCAILYRRWFYSSISLERVLWAHIRIHRRSFISYDTDSGAKHMGRW